MRKFPCMIIRSGTSKGVFFKEDDMPKDREKWTKFLLDVMGSPDKRQIDGLGGGNSLTSKVAIVGRSEDDRYDVNYTFAQVSLDAPKVDFKGNCGNISSGVGVFAVESGLVEASGDMAKVRILNTNTQKVIHSEIKIKDGSYDSHGTTFIPGVPTPGSTGYLSFFDSEGAVTGKVLPTGNAVDEIETSVGKIKVSIVDAANPLIYIHAEDVGLVGTELHYDYTKEQLDLLEEIRSIGAELCGFASRKEATKLSPAVPKTTVICSPKEYKDVNGNIYKQKNMDLVIRMMSMQKPHQALAITGAVCTTVAKSIPGTLVADLSAEGSLGHFNLGHPGGIMPASFGKEEGAFYVKVERTARVIMEGMVHTRNNY